MSNLSQLQTESIYQRYIKLKENKAHLRTKDAAKELGISEAELLSAFEDGSVIALALKPKMMFERLRRVGKVMCLTRNEHCVIEHKGHFQSVKFSEDLNAPFGLTIGEIELRCMVNKWKYCFYVTIQKENRTLESIQIFDKEGNNALKIYKQRHTDDAAFDQLVADLKKDAAVFFEPTESLEQTVFDTIQNKEMFLEDWQAMTDPHQFSPLLKKYNADRIDALRAVEGEKTKELPKESIAECLEYCAQYNVQIMIFVGNKANIQIHQDVVKNIKMMDMNGVEWLNVLDPNFNLHLKNSEIGTVFKVEKPSESGPILSLEVFDKEDQLMTQIFGIRKPQRPQKQVWLDFVEGL